MTAEATRDEADLEETRMTSPRTTSDRRRALRTRLALLCVAAGALTIAPSSALASPPVNDDFANAHDLDGGSTASASGTNLDAGAEPGEPDHDGVPAMASVWYRWTAPADGTVKVDTCSSDFDTVLAVYTGSAIDTLTSVASNDDTCDLQSRVRFNATAGTTYLIAVDGYGGQEGAIALELRPSNAFRFGKLKRNERRGTAKLTIKTTHAGDLKLARTELVRRATASTAEAGKVKLKIEPTRGAMRTLDERGRVKVDAEVTFTPEGGEPKTKNKRLKLIKS
jgi:hypothetical protein